MLYRAYKTRHELYTTNTTSHTRKSETRQKTQHIKPTEISNTLETNGRRLCCRLSSYKTGFVCGHARADRRLYHNNDVEDVVVVVGTRDASLYHRRNTVYTITELCAIALALAARVRSLFWLDVFLLLLCVFECCVAMKNRVRRARTPVVPSFGDDGNDEDH